MILENVIERNVRQKFYQNETTRSINAVTTTLVRLSKFVDSTILFLSNIVKVTFTDTFPFKRHRSTPNYHYSL